MNVYFVIRDPDGRFLQPSVANEPERGFIIGTQCYTYCTAERAAAYLLWWKAKDGKTAKQLENYVVQRLEFVTVPIVSV